MGSFFITPIYTGDLISVEAIPILDQNNTMTGFILAVQDISPDIKKYQTIDIQLSQFQTTLENEIRKIPINCEKLEQNFHQAAGIIRDMSLSRLPLTTLNLKDFLLALQKKTGHECDIRINIFNEQWNTRILADAYSLTRALVFLFKHLSRISSLTEFNLIISHSADTVCFEVS